MCSVNHRGDTVIHKISKIPNNCTIELLKCFLELKPNILNVLNRGGITPLQCAIWSIDVFSNELDLNTKNLILYIALQIKLGAKISEENVKVIQEDGRTHAFYINCVCELDVLENFKISSDCSNVCLIEFLTKNVYELSKYCRNKDLHFVLNSGVFQNFPIYGESLRTNFIDAKLRMLDLDVAMTNLQYLFCETSTSEELPYLFMDKVFRRFSKLELQDFIEAFD